MDFYIDLLKPMAKMIVLCIEKFSHYFCNIVQVELLVFHPGDQHIFSFEFLAVDFLEKDYLLVKYYLDFELNYLNNLFVVEIFDYLKLQNFVEYYYLN
jgi:hypothetical protein